MQSETKYYIAELGTGSKDIIKKYAEQMEILSASVNAIEVFDTPFDAIRSLNKSTRLMPEHHVTVYCTTTNLDTVIISNNLELRILATVDSIDFVKYNTIVLGSLVHSL